jgi:hypothetical protein
MVLMIVPSGACAGLLANWLQPFGEGTSLATSILALVLITALNGSASFVVFHFVPIEKR